MDHSLSEENIVLTEVVAHSDQERIQRFVCIFADRCTPLAVSVPEAMQAGPRRGDGWIPWKPVDSPLIDDDIRTIETMIGYPFPPLFRAYLLYKCLLMTEFFVILPSTPFDDPLREVREYADIYLSNSFYKKRGLIPFGDDPDGIGPICFDVERVNGVGDCPIVRVDQTQTGNPNYRGETISESFSTLLDRIEEELLSYDEG